MSERTQENLSPMAVWACRSAFCMRRGPFWVPSLKHAQADAGKHGARRFLGVFPHATVVGPRRGETIMGFLRAMRLARP